MTLADIIRAHPDLPAKAVAKITGASPGRVYALRYRDQNLSARRKADRGRYVPKQKQERWDAIKDARLLALIGMGVTYANAGLILGENRNSVAGRLFRLRQTTGAQT